MAAVGGVGALAACALASPEHIDEGPVICPFRRITGLPCPGCGLTRSWVYLLHGWWREGVAANPFGVVLLVGVLALVVVVARRLLLRRPPPDVDRFLLRPPVLALMGVWLVFGLLRMSAQVG